MTTPRDLVIIAVEVASTARWTRRSVARAGGSRVDHLLAAGTIRLDGTQVMPGNGTALPDRLLD